MEGQVPRRIKGHKLTMEWSHEYGEESSSTGTCTCGWQESASSQRVVRFEYREHLKDEWARMQRAQLPKPVKTDSRICFGIKYFASEADADRYAEHVVATGQTYNGGFYHGMACGRDKTWDHVDKELGQLYAVTTR